VTADELDAGLAVAVAYPTVPEEVQSLPLIVMADVE
jgi:hypothetical protein